MKTRTKILLASLCLFCIGIVNAQMVKFTSAVVVNIPLIHPTLNGFTGSEKNNIISLSWSTAGEHNSSHFIIERSADGLAFDSVGAVTAVGRFRLPTTYKFEDQQPNTGSNYYRVKIADLDGTAIYGKVFRIEASKERSALRNTTVAKLKL